MLEAARGSAGACSMPLSATAFRSDLGAQWVGSDHARVQGLAGELGLGMFSQFGEGKNLLDVGGTRRLYRGTIPRLGPGVLWDIFIARRRIAKLARGVGCRAALGRRASG